MSYDLERLPDDPVILFKGYKDFGAPNELGQAVGDIMCLLDQQPEPVYLIQDERLHRTPNVEEMIRRWPGKHGHCTNTPCWPG
jgi:hypothetical protein